MSNVINFNSERAAYALIGVIAFCVFANTLRHGFVYDDNRQILMNPLIQRSELYGKALTSDVWGFKGTDTVAASNYFRPTFVAWLIANWVLFGPSPVGWHLLSVLLHVGVCLLLFAYLRRLGCDQVTATLISILFAVHPVHVETVAWISGATDSLLALFLLSSLILAHAYAVDPIVRWRRTALLILSIASFVLACGAKEVALFAVPIFWLVFRQTLEQPSSMAALRRTLPFAIAGLAFFAIRWWVLGALFLPVEDPVQDGAVLTTLPSLFIFYMKQIFWPASLSIALPIRPVEVYDFANVVFPGIVSLALIAGLLYLARRSVVQMVGFAVFALTLFPALRISSFPFEQIAHDRYLYLPLAGLLMIIVPAMTRPFDKPVSEGRRNAIAVTFGLLTLLLAGMTVSYNRAWMTSETLWRHAVTVDPASAHAWFNLAASTSNQRESLNAYDRSLQLRRSPTALVGRARALVGLGDLEGGVLAAREAIQVNSSSISAYTLFQAYEVESYSLAGLGRFSEAETSLRSARQRLPIYYAALTQKLAIVLYSQNRKQDALVELESAREQSHVENLIESKAVLLRLGMLYAELGNHDAARIALREYLASTEGLAATPASDRKHATDLLGQL